MDLDDLGIRRELVLTYAVLSRLAPVQNVLESLDANGIGHRFCDWVRVEATRRTASVLTPKSAHKIARQRPESRRPFCSIRKAAAIGW